jgi:hypothetical protein
MSAQDSFDFALPDGTYVKARSKYSIIEVDAWARKNFPEAYPAGTKTGSYQYSVPNGTVIEIPNWMDKVAAERLLRETHPEYFAALTAKVQPRVTISTEPSPQIDRSTALIETGEQVILRAVLAAIAIILIAGRPYRRKLLTPTQAGRWFAAHGAGIGIFVGPQGRARFDIEENIAGTVVIAILMAILGFLLGYIVQRVRARK